MSSLEFTNIAIPVTPPSRNPFGNKKALRPILANMIPMAIWKYSESDRLIVLVEKLDELKSENKELKDQMKALTQKFNSLAKTMTNEIFTAIKTIAEEEELDFVFDRSGDILFLYAKDEYDITNKVFEKLK